MRRNRRAGVEDRWATTVRTDGDLDRLRLSGEQVEANRHTDRGWGLVLVTKIVRFGTVVLGAVGVATWLSASGPLHVPG